MSAGYGTMRMNLNVNYFYCTQYSFLTIMYEMKEIFVCVGFVSYGNADHANLAIRSSHGYLLDCKPLIVALSTKY